MRSPRRFFYVLTVLTLAGMLVVEPLPARVDHGALGRTHTRGSSPFRGILGALDAVPRVIGAGARTLSGFFGDVFGGSGATAAAASPSPYVSPSAAPSPDAPGEVVSMRSRDASFYRTPGGATRVEFGHYLHYQSAPGRWDDVDLRFRADGSDYVADRHDVVVRVSGSTVQATERASGKGLQWLVGSSPSVSGRKASYSDQGLAWSFCTQKTGLELQASVAAARGAKSYGFSYKLVGKASALSVNASGDLVSDVFMVPRALIIGANSVEYSAGVWRVASGVASFDFDDSALPASAFPYLIDPQLTFYTTASGDDGYVLRQDTVYPPANPAGGYPSLTLVAASRTKDTGTYYVREGLMRWNTAAIPDTATINAAMLRLFVEASSTVDARWLTADWYASSNWPIDAGDYILNGGSTASGGAWALPVVGADTDFPLASLSSISKTSSTGIRVYMGGAQPTGTNHFSAAALEHTTDPEPRLIVIYNDAAPVIGTPDSPADGAPLPTITPVLKGTATDVDGDPLSFQFQVADNSGFTSNVRSSGWLSNTNTWTVPPAFVAPLPALKDGVSYYWRTQAKDPWGLSSGWSTVRRLDVRVTKLGSRDIWPMWSHGPVTVNLANGNLVMGVPGPSYPTAAGSMGVSASYNSYSTSTTDGLGSGWALNVGEGLASPPDRLIDHAIVSDPASKYDAVELVYPDGGSDYYTHVGSSSTYQAPSGDSSKLQKNADSTWTLTDEDGTIYSFAVALSGTGIANLSSAEISDASPGQGALTYAFSGSPLKIASITDASSRAITFNWSCAGVLVCMTGSSDGVVWKYVADGSGRLSTVNDGTRDVLMIAYDGSGRPQTIKNANDLDPTHASPGYNAAHAVTIAYDTATPARVVSVTDGPVTGQSPASSTWTITYTPGAASTAATRAAHADVGLGVVRAAEGYATVKPPTQQATSNVSKVFYDNLGRVIESDSILGLADTKTLAGYDANDQVLWSEQFLDAGGVAASDNTYDPVNNVILTSQGPDPDGAGSLGRPTTTYRYDEKAIGTSSTAGPGLQGLQAAYYSNQNLAGRPLIRKTDSTVDFDWTTGTPAGLPSADHFSIRWTGNLNIATAGAYTFTANSDDGVRFTIDGIAAIDSWVTQAYARVSQPITLTAGLHKITLDYYENDGSAQIHLRYACGACAPSISDQVIPASALQPAWGNQTTTVDPAGRVAFHHYAEPEKGHADYDLVQVASSNLITSYSYDTTGRTLQKVMPRGNAARTIDASGNLTGSPDTTFATDWAYYSAGETAAPPAACGGGSAVTQAQLQKTMTIHGLAAETSVYDSAGRTIGSTKAAGTTCTTYTAEGRIASDKAPGEGASTTYTYDPAGAQRTAADTSGTVTSEYDEQARVKRSVDSFGAESTFAYDADGDQTQRTAAVGALASNPNYVTNYTYNKADQLTSLTDPASRVYSFTYDARGGLHTTQYPNATFAWIDHNPAGWLSGLYNRHGTLAVPPPATVPADANALSDYTYTYFQDGTKQQETRSGGGFTTQTTDYTYDSAGRLATANIPDANNLHTLRTYSFDLDSNRIQVKDGSTVTATGVYDQTNPASLGVDQLTSYTDHGTLKTYSYTSDGQVNSRTGDTLTWDGRERMNGGTFAGSSLSYSFDAAGRMRQRTGAGVITRYLYSAGSSLFDTTSTGTIQNTDVDGPSGDLAHYLGAPQTGTTTEFLYYTGHGDLAATADPAGIRQNTYTYDPYGTLLQAPPANTSIERWTGRWDKRLDTTSTLIQMGARPYDPALGRFLADDPIEGGSLNTYDYAGQDPMNIYDLDGRCFIRCGWRKWFGRGLRLTGRFVMCAGEPVCVASYYGSFTYSGCYIVCVSVGYSNAGGHRSAGVGMSFFSSPGASVGYSRGAPSSSVGLSGGLCYYFCAGGYRDSRTRRGSGSVGFAWGRGAWAGPSGMYWHHYGRGPL